MVVGTRAQVMHGTADKTSGGLQKKDLKYNKGGKIVSKKKSGSAKKDNRLVKRDTKPKRVSLGLFIRVRMNPKKRRNLLERVPLRKVRRKDKGLKRNKKRKK